MTPQGLAFLGLTAIVAALVATLAFAVLRIFSAARNTRQHLRAEGGEAALLSAALQEAVAKLKAQERATALRAEASERLSEQIIASLSAGLLVVNADGEVQTVNPAGRRLLGLPDGTYRGRNYRQLLANAEPLAALIESCLTTGRPSVRRAIEMPARSGAATHLGLTVSPMAGETHAIQGAICLFTDLTEVMALEEQLRLKDSLARVGELTAGLAHEFRNGLATIHGYGRLIDLDALPPALRPCVEGIRAETEAMGEMVTNFLNFARPTQLTLLPVDLRAVSEKAAEDLAPDAKALGGQITIAGDFATIEGDDVLLRQALSNLLRNAIEACAAASRVPAIAIEARVDPVHATCAISVCDNGPGIPSEARERIFHPFFTTKSQGTGLGLALVQKIVVTHNGRVVAGQAPGGGACFTVTLPVATRAALEHS
jgi:PAS domain S-box-containing protein